MPKTTSPSESVYIDADEIAAMQAAIEDDMFAGTTLEDLRSGKLDEEWERIIAQHKAVSSEHGVHGVGSRV